MGQTAAIAKPRPAGATATADPRSTCVAAARELVPVLTAREETCNRERRVPAATVADLKAAGLFRLARPARFGGIDADFDVAMRVAEELARGCGSTAWVYGVVILHDWFMKLWPEAVQREVWESDPDALISSSLQPRPVVRAVGGYVLTGDWPFSSGCDHSQWVQVGAIVKDGPPRLLMVPTDRAEIVDDWHTLGLRGTGSKTLRFRDVFVPEVYAIEHARIASAVGEWCDRPRTGSAWDDTPVVGAGDAFAAVLLGIAGRALDLVANTLRTKVSRGKALGDVELHQQRVGEAAASIDLARFSLMEGSRLMAERLRAGEDVAQSEVAKRLRDTAVQVRRLRDAIDLLSLSHSSWIYDGDPFQRMHRDVFTGATHFAGRWENWVIPNGKTIIAASGAGLEGREGFR